MFDGFVEEPTETPTSEEAARQSRAVERKDNYETLFDAWASIMISLRKRNDFSDAEIENLQNEIDRFAKLYMDMFGGNQVALLTHPLTHLLNYSIAQLLNCSIAQLLNCSGDQLPP